MNGDGGDYIGQWGQGKCLPCNHEALCLIFSVTTGKRQTRCLCLDGFTHLRYPNYMETDSRMVLSGLEKGGSGAPMLSEGGAAALPDGKAPKTGHTGWAHLLSHSFRVANFIFA